MSRARPVWWRRCANAVRLAMSLLTTATVNIFRLDPLCASSAGTRVFARASWFGRWLSVPLGRCGRQEGNGKLWSCRGLAWRERFDDSRSDQDQELGLRSVERSALEQFSKHRDVAD